MLRKVFYAADLLLLHASFCFKYQAWAWLNHVTEIVWQIKEFIELRCVPKNFNWEDDLKKRFKTYALLIVYGLRLLGKLWVVADIGQRRKFDIIQIHLFEFESELVKFFEASDNLDWVTDTGCQLNVEPELIIVCYLILDNLAARHCDG